MRRDGEEDRLKGAGLCDAPDFYIQNAINFQALIQEDEPLSLYKETADERRFNAPELVQIKALPTNRSCGGAGVCVMERGEFSSILGGSLNHSNSNRSSLLNPV